jgi:hypothetical protein
MGTVIIAWIARLEAESPTRNLQRVPRRTMPSNDDQEFSESSPPDKPVLLQQSFNVNPVASEVLGPIESKLKDFQKRLPPGCQLFLGVASLIGVIVSQVIVLFDFIEEMHEKGEPHAILVLDLKWITWESAFFGKPS